MENLIHFFSYLNEVISSRDGFVQFMCWSFILFLVYVLLNLIYNLVKLIFRLIGVFFARFFSSKSTPAALTDAELAEKEFGRLPRGLFVFVFEISTGEMVRQHDERFLCSREIDLKRFKQFQALNLEQAKFKFKNFQQACQTIRKS